MGPAILRWASALVVDGNQMLVKNYFSICIRSLTATKLLWMFETQYILFVGVGMLGIWSPRVSVIAMVWPIEMIRSLGGLFAFSHPRDLLWMLTPCVQVCRMNMFCPCSMQYPCFQQYPLRLMLGLWCVLLVVPFKFSIMQRSFSFLLSVQQLINGSFPSIFLLFPFLQWLLMLSCPMNWTHLLSSVALFQYCWLHTQMFLLWWHSILLSHWKHYWNGISICSTCIHFVEYVSDPSMHLTWIQVPWHVWLQFAPFQPWWLDSLHPLPMPCTFLVF